jgi:putative nucleotidyltransferase with HDIG domain
MAQEEKRRTDMGSVSWTHLRLPPFPQVAVRVLQLANRDNVQLHELSDLISSDPAFASEVLTIANSLLYAPRFPSNSILQAIAVLGVNNLQGLCLTVGSRAYLGKVISFPAMRTIWRHNLATAIIAEQLAAAGFIDKDTAFTCGVLHDIGRLGIAAVRPTEYAAMLEEHCGTPESALEAERAFFGADHCAVGRHLISDWKLPIDFEAIVSEHHLSRQKDGAWGMTELIHVSCRMADTIGFAAFPGCETTPYAELREELPQRERRLFYAEVDLLTEEVSRKIEAVEAV